MKKLFFTFATLLLMTFAIPAYAGSTVTLSVPTHRDFSGVFIDDGLATLLAPDGALGLPIYFAKSKVLTWIVDPSFIEEVQAMSTGYSLVDGKKGIGVEIAKNWLKQFAAVSATSEIQALVYGNPSEYWVKHLAPHDRNYLLKISSLRLEKDLGQLVLPVNVFTNKSYFRLTNSEIDNFLSAVTTIQSTAIYMDPLVLEAKKLNLMRILNPKLSANERAYLSDNLASETYHLMRQVRLATGRFTVTSSYQKLPITVINDFPATAVVSLHINPENERITGRTILRVTVPGKSKIQVMIPIRVLTSGDSGLNISITNSKGDLLGEPVNYPLRLSVISPVATWITTVAAIVLFIAALLQSIRRFRRQRSNAN